MRNIASLVWSGEDSVWTHGGASARCIALMAYALACAAAQELHARASQYARGRNGEPPPPPFDTLLSLGVIPQPKLQHSASIDGHDMKALYEYHIVGVEAGGYIGPVIDSRHRLAKGSSNSEMLRRLRNGHTGDNGGSAYESIDLERLMESIRNGQQPSGSLYDERIVVDARSRIRGGESLSVVVLRMREKAGAMGSAENGEDDILHHIVVERVGNGSTAGGASSEGGGDASANESEAASSSTARIELPEPLVGLATVIRQIERHCAQQARDGGDLSEDHLSPSRLSNDQYSQTVAVLIRGHLCTALSRVLLHGFRSYNRNHLWNFVMEATAAARSQQAQNGSADDLAMQRLMSMVVDIEADDRMGADANVKFRTFVCSALNAQALHEWMRLLTSDDETMSKFFENRAFVNSSADAVTHLVAALQPLSELTFQLSLDYEHAVAEEQRARAPEDDADRPTERTANDSATDNTSPIKALSGLFKQLSGIDLLQEEQMNGKSTA